MIHLSMDGFKKLREINHENDFCHGLNSHVKITDYAINFENHTLIGNVHFTKYSENHVGTCHGGAMCAAVDDIVGWLGYCSGNECIVGSGYTAQINTTLKKPIEINSTLKIIGKIDKIEKRKVWINCSIEDDTNVYCTGIGLFIKNSV